MENTVLTMDIIQSFKEHLFAEEKSQSTINKYSRDAIHFYEFLGEEKTLNKNILIAYKQSLVEKYKITTTNSMLTSVNILLEYLSLGKFKLKLYKVQRKIFYEEEKELTKIEYQRLLDKSLEQDNQRLYMLMQTICSTGIRVSEHRFITVEALDVGKATIHNKGKIRIIFIPKKLRKMLREYCKGADIASGSIFVTKKGKPLDRSNIWRDMQKLCKDANVDSKKVFPHNLRHLFAITYYRLQKDVIRLADILGHSSVETTRIYTMATELECSMSIENMGLVSS